MSDANPFDKLPPHSVEAESCALASLLLAGDDQALIADIRALVTPASFFQPDHETIAQVLFDLLDRGKKIDALIVREELRRRDLLDDVGGVAYLAQILNSIPSAAHGKHYAELVREKYLLRRAIAIGLDLQRDANAAADHDSATEIIDKGLTELAKLNASAAASELTTIGTAAQDAFIQLERGESPLVKTGVKPIDDDLGGIARGETLVIGARPSMGKSTIARQIALSAAGAGTPVGFISLEESPAKIARNLLSALTSVENSRLRLGDVRANEWQQLAEGTATISDLPIYIAARAFTLPAIRSVAAMMVARYGIQILIVDYLQKIRADGKSRYEQVTEASAGVTQLIKELNVAGVILAQLNRGVVGRTDKRPTMADLRESGQIEQDADAILFLHREDYYRSTGEADGDQDGVAELIKSKYRDGCRGGTIFLKSNLRFQRFDPPDTQSPFDQGEFNR